MDGIYIYILLLFVSIYTGRTVGIAEPTQLDSLDPDSFGPLHLCHPAALLLEISFIKGIIHHHREISIIKTTNRRRKARCIELVRIDPFSRLSWYT